jgi:hypothetical protein
MSTALHATKVWVDISIDRRMTVEWAGPSLSLLAGDSAGVNWRTSMQASWLIPAAMVSGLAWMLGVLLIATQASSEPVGTEYDLYTRILSIAIILLLVTAIEVRRRLAQVNAAGASAALALSVGVGVMAAGNLLEFWGAVAAGQPPSATAARLGTEAFWGSTPGFVVFLIGSVVATVALIVIAIRSRRWQGVSSVEALLIGVAGISMSISTALWAVSPAAALVPAALFAFGWMTLARTTAGHAAAGSQRVASHPAES